ncbi:amidohydrolase [Paenibacillaceae bacterium]|nr:amidohydrolase [Paenibacillaceae bacterium]
MIIDAHIHLSDIASFRQTAIELSGVDYSVQGLKAEFDRCGVVLGIGMGVTEQEPGGFPDHRSANPMPLDLADPLPPFLLECLGINPVRLDSDHQQVELDNIEQGLKKKGVAGIKIYAGYYPYYVYDAVYGPVYELAKHYNLPVVIHTGTTYSDRALLKYSHPLTVDEVAVQHRDVQFMICHLGDPWVLEGGEVANKNPNVYADLSGLLVGDQQKFNRFIDEPLFMDHIRRGLVYADNYEKMIFGTDWPLAPIDVYIDFVQRLVPERFHELVFYKNAARLFPAAAQRLQELGYSTE